VRKSLKFSQCGENQSGASAEVPKSKASPSLKIFYGLTHPVQYQSPLIRHLVAGGMDIEVVYSRGEEKYFDREFGCEIAWDLPLMEGYPSRVLPEAPQTLSGSELQKFYLEHLLQAFASERPAAAWLHGWSHPFERAFWEAARRMAVPLMIRGDTNLERVKGGLLRRLCHRMYYTWRFRQVEAFLAVGSLNRTLYRSYGVSAEKIFSTPYAVDNAFFQRRIRDAREDREILRTSLGLPPGSPVILFCGKLIPLKNLPTVIHALGRLSRDGGLHSDAPPPSLLVVGNGAERSAWEGLAVREIPGCAKFIGFRNQTELPALYGLCDLFVLPSTEESFGLAVNEAMNAGVPVIVSDKVGCWPDLVKTGVNGAVFESRDVAALADALKPFVRNHKLRSEAGAASLEIINRWSFNEDLQGLTQALDFVGRMRV